MFNLSKELFFSVPFYYYNIENTDELNRELVHHILKIKEEDEQGLVRSNNLGWHSETNLSSRDEFNQKGVRFKFLGDLADSKIPEENKNLMKETEEMTKNNSNLNLVFAFNYGSQNEIHNAILKLHNENINENLELDYIENSFYNFFQYPEVPFPDVLLRTAGEKRISNFLLYQLSYSELIFIDTLWPDVNEDILDDVLLEFNRRNRTYGRN